MCVKYINGRMHYRPQPDTGFCTLGPIQGHARRTGLLLHDSSTVSHPIRTLSGFVVRDPKRLLLDFPSIWPITRPSKPIGAFKTYRPRVTKPVRLRDCLEGNIAFILCSPFCPMSCNVNQMPAEPTQATPVCPKLVTTQRNHEPTRICSSSSTYRAPVSIPIQKAHDAIWVRQGGNHSRNIMALC